jgi:hypothetical protein
VALVRKMAGAGAGVKVIASALGTTDLTFAAWRREYPELDRAFVEAKEKARVQLHNSLQRRALDPKNQGGVTAAIFLLKARHDYREKDDDADGSRVNIVYTAPQPLSVADYLAAIAAKKANGAKIASE